MSMNTFSCIKCSTQYKSSDEEAYYCESCLTEKNRIAKEIDKKMANRKEAKVKSAVQELQENGKIVRDGLRMFMR